MGAYPLAYLITVMPEGEKNGGSSSKGWAESAPTPLVGMGLTDLQNIGGAMAPLTPWPQYRHHCTLFQIHYKHMSPNITVVELCITTRLV